MAVMPSVVPLKWYVFCIYISLKSRLNIPRVWTAQRSVILVLWVLSSPYLEARLLQLSPAQATTNDDAVPLPNFSAPALCRRVPVSVRSCLPAEVQVMTLKAASLTPHHLDTFFDGCAVSTSFQRDRGAGANSPLNHRLSPI